MNGFSHCLLCCLSLGLLCAEAWAAEEETSAPDFTLPRRGTVGTVRLADQKGSVIVLDFFAHWCVPCVRCSSEVEKGIAQHYVQSKGNPQGVPVEVFCVNVESGQPDKTEAFIKRTGMTRVLDDPRSEVFQKYFGSGLPFLVIIDATGGTTGTAPPRVLYRKGGFEGVAKLRQIIDSVRKSPTSSRGMAQEAAEPPPPQNRAVSASTNPPPVSVAETAPAPATSVLKQETVQAETRALEPPVSAAQNPEPAPAPTPVLRAIPGPNQASLNFETLLSSDIFLSDVSFEQRHSGPRSLWAVSVSEGHIGLHYVPEERIERENDIDNERVGLQTRGRLQVTDRLTLMGSAGTYYGYMDYRSLWLDEHFRQLYSRRLEYQKAHPWGYNVSGGARWEYVPASAFVQGDLVWQQDVISPGYEVQLVQFPPRLVRFRDLYDTLSGKLTLENALTPRIRALQEIQFTDTTARQLRYSLQTSLNVAFAERFVARLAVAGTKESPQFESWSVGATLEHDWNETWFVSLLARYYKDTGQIENALLPENTSAPPLEALQIGLGLRWQGTKSSLKFVAGPYFSRYAAPGAAVSTFDHLYQDRDWFLAQFAFARAF